MNASSRSVLLSFAMIVSLRSLVLSLCLGVARFRAGLGRGGGLDLGAQRVCEQRHLVGSALNVAAAFDIDAFIAPASLASSTSRGSRSASLPTSAAVSALPSSTPPLITSSGFALAKSSRPLAACATSPLTNAIAGQTAAA